MNESPSTPAPSTEYRPIVCRSLDGKEATGHVTLKFLSPPERLKFAFKRLGIFWLVAVIFLPIPGLHFILPPLLLVAGIVAFYRELSVSKERIAGGHAVCPSCQNPLNIPARGFASSFKEVCSACRHEVRISLSS